MSTQGTGHLQQMKITEQQINRESKSQKSHPQIEQTDLYNFTFILFILPLARRCTETGLALWAAKNVSISRLKKQREDFFDKCLTKFVSKNTIYPDQKNTFMYSQSMYIQFMTAKNQNVSISRMKQDFLYHDMYIYYTYQTQFISEKSDLTKIMHSCTVSQDQHAASAKNVPMS